MSKRVFILFGGNFHDFPAGARAIAAVVERAGFQATQSDDANGLLDLDSYAAVALYTQGDDRFTDEQIEALSRFVSAGGGLLGIHGATATSKKSSTFTHLIGAKFVTHPERMDFTVHISDPTHPLAEGMQDFVVHDELYNLDPVSDFHPFLTASWQGVDHPMAYTRTVGRGKVVYLANGHDDRSLLHPVFQNLMERSIAFVA